MTQHPSIVAGRVAVITGGASGIGLAVARRLGAAGMRVVIADREERSLEAAASSLLGAGCEAEVARCDVGRMDDLTALAATASRLGEVSFLMNNAGRGGGQGVLAGEATWRGTLDTNLFGPIWGIHAFLPAMLAAGHPCAIVNTGSKQGITLPPGDTVYNVSKAGLRALTESLAHELLQTKGRVSAHLLIPGFTFTGLTRPDGGEKPAGAWTGEQVADFMLEKMAAGDFYILCPDNEVTRETDEKRMAWGAGDIIENRPALSRWHPDFAEAFKAHMAR